MGDWNLQDYLGFVPDYSDPLQVARTKGMGAAVRRYPNRPMTPTGGPMDSPWGNVNNEPMMGGSPAGANSASLSPGVQAQAPAQPMIGDQRWDPNFTQAYMNEAALSSEDQGLADKGALIESLRGKRHTTGIGGAIGAVSDMLATYAALQNQEKRGNVRDRYMDELRKSLTRNSATGGAEVDPTRDF